MKKIFAFMSITVVSLLTISTVTAQPISRKTENAATMQLLKEQGTGKALTAVDWYNKGVALNNNSDDELECYKKAIGLDPTFAMAYHNMGIIYMTRGNDTEAIKDFNLFLQYSKDETEKTRIQKVITELQGESNNLQSGNVSRDLREKAAELYNQGVALNDNSDKEMEYYLQAIALYPGFAAAHMNLGLLYYNRKDYDRALLELTRYMEYTNDPPEKRKEILKIIEWLKYTITTSNKSTRQLQQTQPSQQSPANNTASPQIKEEPLQ
ncbi:MAG: tetratricopeptide repeat protein [Deltaproteobacteria bacterium]|nr:tetratricopeptide repeat protein [Deltaproteobacteria bacterium]